ncbi:MAG: sodium/proline symporter [Gemmatimonadetes bacterium]|nr:sodium/proline symporter [Gemmatimonadota bacterium]
MTGWLDIQAGAPAAIRHPAIIGIAVFYFVVVSLIGVWATRRTKSASDYFIAGQGIGIVTLAIAAMASTLSGFAFIGGPGLVYSVGTGAVFLVLSASITNTMGAWVLAKRMRLLGEARGLITVPDAIAARFRSPAAQGLSAVAILVAVIGYMATNFLALGLVIDAMFGTGLTLGIWCAMLVTLSYTVAGGILAGVYTDLFEGLVKTAASVTVFYFVLKAGGGLAGISRAIAAVDAAFLGPWGKMPAITALSLFFVFGLGSLGQPHVAHKFYMLRDPRRLKWYPALMSVAMALTLLLYVGVGLAMRAKVASGVAPALVRADDATPAFVLGFTPSVVAGIVFAGVIAAGMSTVNSFMNIGAAALTHDLPRAFGRRVSDELRWGRAWTLFLSLLAVLVAQVSGTLVAFLGIFGYGLFAATLVPSLAIGLNWQGATREGAVASVATGLGLTLVFETLAYFRVFTLPAGVTVSGLALLASLLVFFGVSWLTRARAASQLDADVKLVMEV